MIDGKVHHFSAGGLYDGLVLLIDDETRSYWDHITGQALAGPLAGRRLPTWPLVYTTVGAALAADPQLECSRPAAGVVGRVMAWMHSSHVARKGWLPPLFRRTMAPVDPRLDELCQGLGVVAGDEACFYPRDRLGTRPVGDRLDGRPLQVALSADGIPFAVWDTGGRPMQLFSRWYGFSANYPACKVYPDPTLASTPVGGNDTAG